MGQVGTDTLYGMACCLSDGCKKNQLGSQMLVIRNINGDSIDRKRKRKSICSVTGL